MVRQTLITSCYNELMDSLRKSLTLYYYDLLFNILHTPCNLQKTLKSIKR